VKELSPNCQSWFLKTELPKLKWTVFGFWGQLASVWFSDNRYPTLSSGSAHPYFSGRFWYLSFCVHSWIYSSVSC